MQVNNLSLCDKATLSTREITQNGYLKAKARLARVGVLNYLGAELGLTGEDASKIIKVYKPADVILGHMQDYNGLDITFQHPKEYISPKNYRNSNVVVGVVTSNGMIDEGYKDYVTCDILIKDEDAIKYVNAGCVEMSLGATSSLSFTKGKTPDGLDYDAIVTSQKLNHVAIVPSGRAGSVARILDSNPFGGDTMDEKEKEVQSLKTEKAELEKQLKDAKDMLAEAQKVAEQEQARADALEIKVKQATDEQKLKDEAAKVEAQIKDSVNAVLKALDDARTLAGKDFTCDEYNVRAIKVKAINTVDSSMDLKDKSDVYIDGVFDTLIKNGTATKQSHAAVAQALNKEGATAKTVDNAPSPYDQYKARLSNAYKVSAKED